LPNTPDTSPRFTVPGYTDVRLVGRGGFSTVWYAMQTQYERVVALKVLDVGLEDERTKRQFQRECAATGRLSGHPNIVTILDSGFTSQGMPFLAMDYCSQGSLLDRISREGPLPVADVLRIGVKMCGALESAHQKDILHRDLKPENILVNAYGEPGLADFGIATVTARLESSVTMHALTPSHAPPEVLEGKKATELSDVYSLSSTLYVLLAGRPAFSMGADPSILQFLLRVTSDPVPPIPRADVPQVVQDVLIAAMAKDPAYRYQSAADFGKALQQLQAHLGYPVTELVTLVPMPGATAASALAPTPAPAPASPPPAPGSSAPGPPAGQPAPGALDPQLSPQGLPQPTAASQPRAAKTGPAPQFAPAPPDPTVIPPPPAAAVAPAAAAPPRPQTGPVAPPPPPGSFAAAPASPDATMMRPGTDTGTGSAAPTGGTGGNGAGRDPGAPAGPVVAPPLPSPDLYGGPDTGSATVYHERAVPVIEAADLTPPREASKPSPILRTVAIVVVIVLLAGVGYLAFTRLKGDGSVDAGGPATSAVTVATTNAPTTAGRGPDPSVTTATTPSSGAVTTTGGSTGGTITAPENVSVKVLANESVQVTWSDPSGGKAPYVYEVVSPDGQVLSKISAVGPGTTSTVVTETNNGPLKTESTTYCVAVGAIGGPGKPLWAAAPCTDGTTVTVS
jgi:serine/threonine-protein kinase PknK